MANDIYFRTSIAGYNKNDVMRFIEKLNSDQVERVNDLNDQIRSSQTESRKLSAELDVIRKRCDELEYTLSLRDKGDISNAEKAVKYDELQKNYADIMLEAESTSKEKIRQSEEKSSQIVAEANAYYEKKIKELRENKDRLVMMNKEILKSSMSQLESLILSLEKSLEDTWSTIGLGEDNE